MSDVPTKSPNADVLHASAGVVLIQLTLALVALADALWLVGMFVLAFTGQQHLFNALHMNPNQATPAFMLLILIVTVDIGR